MNKKFFIGLLTLLLIILLTAAGCSSTNNQSEESSTGTSATENQPSDTTETEDVTVNQEDSNKDTAPESTEWLTFTNQEHLFTIDYPSNWIIVDPGNSYGVVFRPYEDTQMTFYVDTHKSIFDDMTIDDYVDEMIGDLMRIRDTASFGEPVSVQINDYPFTSLDYQETATDGETYYYQSYFTANDYGYIVYYVIPEKEYEEIAPIADQIAMSFKFIK